MTSNGIPVNGVEALVEASSTTVRLGPGLLIGRGMPDEEYLDALRPWSRLAKIYKEMADDTVIGAVLDAIKSPLLASEFSVLAAGESDADKDAAFFLEQNIHKMVDMEWFQHVEDIMEFLTYGFSVSEKVLEKRSDGRMWLATLIPIGQETLQDWGEELDKYGNVTEFRQNDPVSRKIISAPIDKLIHITYRSRKRNPQGRSMLRSLYRAWYFKKNLEVLEAIGAERDVGNTPVAELGETGISAADLTLLEDGLKAFRIDEAGYLITPRGVKINAYGGGNKVYNIREMIRDWQHLIRQRLFVDFIAQGAEEVGTQALAKEMTSFFSVVLKHLQRLMISTWNRQLVPYIFRYNNFDIEELPKLDWKPPGAVNLIAMAQSMSTLVGAKMLTPSRELENYIRQLTGLPELIGDAVADTDDNVEPPDEDSEFHEVPRTPVRTRIADVVSRRHHVHSSNLRSYKYSESDKELEVAFLSGRVYKYTGVPVGVIERFKESESKGAFFHANIRTTYSYARIR